MIPLGAQTFSDLHMEEYVTWTALVIVLSLVGGVPSILLGWLHIRLNSFQKEHKDELIRVESKVDKAAVTSSDHRRELQRELQQTYVQKDALDAKFETVNTSINSLSTRVGDFIQIMNKMDDKIDALDVRVAKMEA